MELVRNEILGCQDSVSNKPIDTILLLLLFHVEHL